MNIAANPFSHIKVILKTMIVFMVENKKVTTDEEICRIMNETMSLAMKDLKVLLRELVNEDKIVSFGLKVPMEVKGNYCGASVYGIVGTLPE